MRRFDPSGRKPSWVRVLLATLLLAFACNSIAHVTHQHDGSLIQLTDAACSYCSGFILIDAPAQPPAPPFLGRFTAPQLHGTAIQAPLSRYTPEARAPPLL